MTYVKTKKSAAPKKPWSLEIVLSRDGEQDLIGTVARFKTRKEFTAQFRRLAAEALRSIKM